MQEGNSWAPGQGRGGMKVTVNRGSVLQDAYTQLAPLGSRIKQPLMVAFVDEHGAQEAGAPPDSTARVAQTPAPTPSVLPWPPPIEHADR